MTILPSIPERHSGRATNTKITIGVCVRNSASTIREAIESIMNQDFPHESMEVVFVDDGSGDETLSIIQEYALKIDMPVKVIHTSWKGLGRARNLVSFSASGKYILWVDGDMLLSKDFVGKLVDFMERHPEVGVAKGKQALEPGANILATLEAYSRAAGRMVDYSSENARLKALGTGGAIYRAQIIGQAVGFDEKMRGYGEDWDIEIRIRKAGWSFTTVDATFFDYERHGLTWKNLYVRYWLRGYYTHYFLHKNKGFIQHYKMIPPAAFVTGVLHSHKLFTLTRKRTVFFLPLQYLFKMTVWYIGFARSHIDSYEPNL